MTRKVVALKQTESLYSAINKFAKKGISGAPVLSSGNRVIGVVSDADLTRALDVVTPSVRITSSNLFSLAFASLRSKKEEDQLREELKEAKNVKVRSFMSKPIIIQQDASIMDAIKKMTMRKINRLPVVNGKKKLVGIIARTDLIKAISSNFCDGK